jgi:type 1 fimbria pilin
MMKYVVRLACLMLAVPHIAHAYCRQMTDEEVLQEQQKGYPETAKLLTLNIAFPPSMTIDPDAPNGVIYAAQAGFSGIANYAACVGGGTIDFATDGIASTVSPYYATNINNIIFRVRRYSGAYQSMPFSLTIPPGNPPNQIVWPRWEPTTYFVVELAKIGPLTVGINTIVFNNPIATGKTRAESGYPSSVVFQVNSPPTQIKVLPKCTVKASAITIDFGTFGPRDVQVDAGPTRPFTVDLTCTGPTPPASITAMLSGTADVIRPEALQNSVSAGAAKNLVIRIAETGTNTVLKPNNADSSFTKAPDSDRQSSLSFNATVLRDGGGLAPSAGVIDATATITLTIL